MVRESTDVSSWNKTRENYQIKRTKHRENDKHGKKTKNERKIECMMKYMKEMEGNESTTYSEWREQIKRIGKSAPDDVINS